MKFIQYLMFVIFARDAAEQYCRYLQPHVFSSLQRLETNRSGQKQKRGGELWWNLERAVIAVEWGRREG